MGHSSFQGGPSRNPTPKNAEDFHGLTPKAFPHLCTLCELPLHSLQGWDEHLAGNIHKKQRQALLNLSSGNMGPPPPPMHMGAPDTPRGNFRGKQGMQGQGQKQNNQGPGRVIHVLDFERKDDLKSQLIKLVKPFGKVTNVLIMDKKELAFVEMATPAQANAVASHFDMNPAKMYGKAVRVGLSQKYSQLKANRQRNKMQPKVPQQGPKQQNKQGPKQQNKQGPKQQNKQGPKWQNKQAPAEPKGSNEEEKAQAPNEQPKEGSGRVVRICNLPKYGYSQQKVLSLAKNYGKVTNYILMRHQAFVEMERAEDAQAMIDACAKTPLKLQGRVLYVILSQKYKNLVLKMPPRPPQREER
ncbi:matrin-3-like [Gastrophryne carolinensis]